MKGNMNKFNKYLEQLEGQLDDPRFMGPTKRKLDLSSKYEKVDRESELRNSYYSSDSRVKRRWMEIDQDVKKKVTEETLFDAAKSTNKITSLAKECIWDIGKMIFDVNNFQKDLEFGKINTKDVNMFINQLQRYSIM